jgi:membrane-bound lytic murein transglycosylase MltF
MADAGIVAITIVDDHIARFWARLYEHVTVHEDLAVRTGGRIGIAVRKTAPELRHFLDGVVKTHRVGTTFGNIMVKRYLGDVDRLRNPARREDLERFRAAIGFLRHYAGEYGMDWLLVGAQAYQESRLDQRVRSRSGAVGVMQIKPQTAADPRVAVANVERLENNIHAGVKYLRLMIDDYYGDEAIAPLDRELFAFASYNAGPRRIAQLRREAESLGLDPNRWFHNVEHVAARRIGRETVDYVSNIYKYYTAYKAIVRTERLRKKATRKLSAPGALSPP